MTLGEIFIVIIVAIIALKPEDYSFVLKQARRLYKYFTSFKSEIESELEKIANIEDEESDKDQINFYLQKIMEHGEVYNGEYSLSSVKAFYHKLIVKNKIERKKDKV